MPAGYSFHGFVERVTLHTAFACSIPGDLSSVPLAVPWKAVPGDAKRPVVGVAVSGAITLGDSGVLWLFSLIVLCFNRHISWCIAEPRTRQGSQGRAHSCHGDCVHATDWLCMRAAVQALEIGSNSPGGLVGVHSRHVTQAERAAHHVFKSFLASSLPSTLLSRVSCQSLVSDSRLLTAGGSSTVLLAASCSTATSAPVVEPRSRFWTSAGAPW